MGITEMHLVFFFSQFRQDGDIAAMTGKIGFATGDYELKVTLNRNTTQIPDILTCWGRIIFIVVEDRRACGTVEHVSRAWL